MKAPCFSRSYYGTPRPRSWAARREFAPGQLDEVPDAAAFAGAGLGALEPASLEVFVSVFVSGFVSDLVSDFELSDLLSEFELSEEDPLLLGA
jgi:hypothetical protein